MSVNIVELLGADAKNLLDHKCTTIPKESIHVPSPSFVDDIFIQTDRPTPVLKSI